MFCSTCVLIYDEVFGSYLEECLTIVDDILFSLITAVTSVCFSFEREETEFTSLMPANTAANISENTEWTRVPWPQVQLLVIILDCCFGMLQNILNFGGGSSLVISVEYMETG